MSARRYLLKRRWLAVLLLIVAAPVSAQKEPTNELGFQPGKLYDFSEVDSVNLFNGNLMLSVPIGPRKQVSPALSYQIQVFYNGKVWDFETYEGCVPFGQTHGVCQDQLPNRRSNAGLGWRVSFGRLLPPYEPTNHRKSTDERQLWIYESPAGDEHAFGGGSTDRVRISADASALRLVRIDTGGAHPHYDVEFPSGEVHRFQMEEGAYRLKKISDRFASYVQFTYTYAADDAKRVVALEILDSTLTRHTIHYGHETELSESVDRGAVVESIELQGFRGATVTYDFQYATVVANYIRQGQGWQAVVPVLTGIVQPDGTTFGFDYHHADNGATLVEQGTILRVTLPTGGTTEYRYHSYALPAKKTCGGPIDEPGIKSRAISDGVTTRTWDYSQVVGALAPFEYPDPGGDYCCSGNRPSHPRGPSYWLRTSVLSPRETLPSGAVVRSRSDHYFDAYSYDFESDWANCPNLLPDGAPRPTDPLGARSARSVLLVPERRRHGPVRIPGHDRGSCAEYAARRELRCSRPVLGRREWTQADDGGLLRLHRGRQLRRRQAREIDTHRLRGASAQRLA